jgi:hypothetical protein
MAARVLAPVSVAGAQQKDNLCGPFWASRVLRESGFAEWDGQAIDEDLVAWKAGSLLPEPSDQPTVPPGAASKTGYRLRLATAPAAESGTSAPALQAAIEAASGGALRCVPVRGRWTVDRVQGLVERGRKLAGARLIANVRTGRLWGSRPSLEVLLAELEGRPLDPPPAEWDVGHFVELVMVLHGPERSLVLVHDSYPTLGVEGRHLQPPRAVAAALARGDGREGGVLVVVPAPRATEAATLARDLGLEVGTWNNGTRS